MIAIPIENVDKIINSYNTEIDNFKKDIVKKLNKLTLIDVRQNQYKACLIDFFENKNGLILKKNDLNDQMNIFNSKFKKSDITSKEWKIFKDKILRALDYTDKRSNFYPKYFQKIGIKSCVYCNSQLCVTASSKAKVRIAKFQVDHYLNKSEYPCFSVSFFNLYPVCSSCNNRKGVNNIEFDLYAELKNIKKSNFGFRLKEKEATVAKYLLNRNLNDIEIEFTEPIPPLGHKKLNDVFHIEGIYNTQKDLAEELILKAEVYSKEYKATLENSFPKIFNSNMLDRLIIGNYTEENEIHNRPMAKFTQDIAIQLGLLKQTK